MADSKIYLNVPYAEKDAAKALGAKWDASRKKWYVPGNIDTAVFAKWHIETTASVIAASKTATTSPASNPSADKAATGVITYPTTKDFTAYNGDAPPWD